ncbi:MAG: 2Fe-2S iron-sulfur cluster-binding protein [Candidatus Latescibacter sp.]|nr:2Fe-2S iron-sulfur cluster-binding protein [Candidatus Latescibacter sp.]
MITCTINDKVLQAEEGKTILEVARDEGIHIPTLCYHKDLTPYGACRLCVVEIVGGSRPGIQVSCLYKVTEGLIVKTDTERVVQARKIIIELLMARCSDSDKINKLADEYGVTNVRIHHEDQSKCILCGQCVRVCAEVVGMSAISFSNRGIRRRVQTPFDKISETCIGCGACAYLCPTRVIHIEESS